MGLQCRLFVCWLIRYVESNRTRLHTLLISGDGILVLCLGARYTFTKACGGVWRLFHTTYCRMELLWVAKRMLESCEIVRLLVAFRGGWGGATGAEKASGLEERMRTRTIIPKTSGA